MSEPECRYPCGCEQFPEEHCACMEGHERKAGRVNVEALVDAVLDEAKGYRIDRAILTVALSRALPDDGLRARMEALADEFDAKGRRGSAHFGADVGDTIRLWIDRDPRGECVHPPEHVTSDGLRWPLTCDACRDERGVGK